MHQKWKFYIPEIIFILLISLLPLLWMRSGEIIIGHDSAITLKLPQKIENQFYSWNSDINTGTDKPFDRAFLPFYVTEYLLSLIFPFDIVQRIVFVGWFFLMGLSMFLFVRELYPLKEDRIIRVLSSVFYTINFFILELWFIADRPKFSFFVLLPLSYLILHKLFSHTWSIKKSSILFFYLFLLFNCAGLPPILGAYAIAFTIPFVIFSIREIFLYKIKGLRYVFIAFFSFLLMGLLSQAYWLLPFYAYTSTGYSAQVDSLGGIEGTINWEKMISVNASMVNVLRIAGSPNWVGEYAYEYATLYSHNPLLIFLSLIPVFFLLYLLFYILWKRKKVQHKIWLFVLFCLFVIGVFLSAGTHRPTGIVFELLMRYLPGFAIFRSSYYKFMPFVIYSMSILFSVGVYYAYRNSKFLLRYSFGVLVFFLSILFINNTPMFTSNPFQFSWGFSTLVTLPPYINEMRKVMNELPENSKILLVPELTSEFINTPIDGYNWGYYSIEPFPLLIFNGSIISNSYTSPAAMSTIYNAIKNKKPEEITNLAKILGVSHILLRKDVKHRDLLESSDGFKDWENMLLNVPHITKVAEKGDWSLYEFDTQSFFSSYPALSFIYAPTDSLTYATSFNDQQNDAIVFSSSVFSEKTEAASDMKIWRAECIVCKLGELDTMIKGVDISAYKTRTSNPSNLVSKKELEVYNNSTIDYGARIDMDLAFSNRALALLESNSEVSSTYISYITDAFSYFEKLPTEKKNNYAIRLLTFLKAQKDFVNLLQIDKEVKDRIVSFIDTSIPVMNEHVFVSEPENGIYRYTSQLNDVIGPIDIIIEDVNSSLWDIYIDGDKVTDKNKLNVTPGYNQIEVIGKNGYEKGRIPAVFFRSVNEDLPTSQSEPVQYKRISPVEYNIALQPAAEEQILFFPQTYHSGWVLIDNTKNSTYTNNLAGLLGLVSNKLITKEYSHIELFGFGNGWIIPRSDDIQQLTVLFIPQKYSVIGFLITIVSMISITVYSMFIVAKHARRRYA